MKDSRGLLGSNILGRGKQIYMQLINDSNKCIKLPGGKCVGFSQTVGKGYLCNPMLCEKAGIREVDIHLASDPTLPSHLEDLFKRSAKYLDEDERMQLKCCLWNSTMCSLSMIWTLDV